jgi:hypothetical protein
MRIEMAQAITTQRRPPAAERELRMNAKQIGLGLVLADFAGLTAYAVYHYGYLGFFESLMSNAVGITALVDLCIALTLVMAWMVRDARTRGISVAPYIVATLIAGSVGPLAYLIRRERAEVPVTAGLRAAA